MWDSQYADVTPPYPRRAHLYSQLRLVLTPHIKRGKPTCKCQPVIMDDGVRSHERAAGWGGCRVAAETERGGADRGRPQRRDLRCVLPLFPFKSKEGKIWLLFHKVKSNSSMWSVSELIIMINWLSTQISSERRQAARHQG